MTKLIALLALAGAAAAGLFFWRKNRDSVDSAWSSAKDAPSSWSKTAAHEASTTADRVSAAAESVTHAAAGLADDLKGSTATRDAKEAAKSAADSATTTMSTVADKLDGGSSQ